MRAYVATIITIATVFCFIPSGVQANETATGRAMLSGRVTEQVCISVHCSTSPVKKAEVDLCPIEHTHIVTSKSGSQVQCDAGFQYTTKTKKDGQYIFAVRPGTYELSMPLSVGQSSADVPVTLGLQRGQIKLHNILIDSGAR
jgi:hypothetical protein